MVNLTPSGEQFNKKVNGILSKLIQHSGIDGRLGTFRVFNNIAAEFASIAVVGLGKEGAGYNQLETIEEGLENARVAAAAGARLLDEEDCHTIHVDAMNYPEAVAEGSTLSVWRYEENKEAPKRKLIPRLELYGSRETDEWTRGLFKADSQNLVRRLSKMPANQMTPRAFAQAAVDLLCPCNVNVEVRNVDWIESQKMSSLLTVAYSSCEKPYFLELNYCGNPVGDQPILLVGKGLTYNSGGLCLKDAAELPMCHASMAGAAVVVATIRAAAALQLPINISGVIPLCENMPSGKAFRSGDIITCLNGKTVAAHDTRNAGVLVLADTLTYAQTLLKPRMIINVATLTDGVESAFGGGATGVLSTSDELWHELNRAGAVTGDRVWRLPLWKYFSGKMTRFPDVDVSNRGLGKGSTCLAAAFFKEFIPSTEWMHLDIKGVGMSAPDNLCPYLKENGLTGRPVRTLIQFLYQLACPQAFQAEKDAKKTCLK